MYAYIKGTLEEVGNQQVILEANGIGYLIYVPNTVISDLPGQGEATKLFTYMHLREDVQELYGFLDEEDKLFFEKLITVSGIGPKAALNMLSSYSRLQLATAILTGDSKLLSTVPGVGRKTADRIILELKDKL
ncbi:MAG TPA: Holliday junction branch migration protein RuvA, partial [Candidatus Atribacteria bacterium]|nr:Holliday junction branch migration protein RuvA [Candidatus Atribacteria bacterium]